MQYGVVIKIVNAEGRKPLVPQSDDAPIGIRRDPRVACQGTTRADLISAVIHCKRNGYSAKLIGPDVQFLEELFIDEVNKFGEFSFDPEGGTGTWAGGERFIGYHLGLPLDLHGRQGIT